MKLKPTDTVSIFQVICNLPIDLSTQSAPSQLWLFETALPIGRDEVHASRQLREGNYHIRNSHDNIYLEIKNRRDVRGTDIQPLPSSAKVIFCIYRSGLCALILS